jgi:hypothetical protein
MLGLGIREHPLLAQDNSRLNHEYAHTICNRGLEKVHVYSNR